MLISSILIVLFFLSVNINILTHFGYELEATNGTNGTNSSYEYASEVLCEPSFNIQGTDWMNYYGQVHLFIYSVIPFGIIAFSNCALLLNLYVKYRGALANVHRIEDPENLAEHRLSLRGWHQMNKIVILITFLFICFTLPLALASFYLEILLTTDTGQFFIIILDCVSFSFHGLNFFIIYFSNVIFRHEVDSVLDIYLL
jgi:hypothetical protein